MTLQAFYSRKTLTRLVVSMVFVRSLIAVGFMLSVSGNGIELVTCDGPVSFKPATSVHDDHNHHHSIDNEIDSQLHISPSCGDWSSSGLLALDSFVELIVVDKSVSRYLAFYSVFINQTPDSKHSIRAPPVLA